MDNYIKKKEKNKHINKDLRLKIEALYNNGVKLAEIAKIIGCCRATIYNEMNRGLYKHKLTNWTYEKRYSAEIAQRDYDYKSTAKGAPLKIGNDHELAELIEICILELKWSPDMVTGFIKANHLDFTHISTATLYNYIKKGVFYKISEKNLLIQGKKKRSYKKLCFPVKNVKFNSISCRSELVSERKSFGHWEMDTVIGCRKGKKTCLLVLTERFSRYEICIKIQDKTTASVLCGLKEIKKDFGKQFSKVFQTITIDNGAEFSDYSGMKNILGNTDIFYCHPYSSWERGSNENQNKIIRRFIPKGVDICKYSDAFILKVQNYMNSIPRKILGYRTSFDVFSEYLKVI